MYKFLFSLILFVLPFTAFASDWVFGGMYEQNDGDSNPLTGAPSCPSGYSNHTMDLTGTTGHLYHYCYKSVTLPTFDPTITTPIAGQVIMYNGSSWVNFATSTGGGGGTTVNNFSSTTLLSVATGTALNISSEPVNMANGMLLFMISFWGTIWFFRRNR